jgi:uncharacterized membrane protein
MELMAILMLVEFILIIFICYGINGRYFRETENYLEGLALLRKEKPRVAKFIGILVVLMAIEFFIASAISATKG